MWSTSRLHWRSQWRFLVPVLGLSAACGSLGDDSKSVAPLTQKSTAALAKGGVPEANFTAFESGQVRPLALSPNGKLLFAVNTPDNRLEIFRVQHHGLRAIASIPVGLEPVAVAARSDREVWVVNHLSDSISIVKLDGDCDDDDGDISARVVRTLLVGDEPRDLVFAGPGKQRAFITTAHRGQNVGFDPQFTTPGIGRADVWVFDAAALGTSLGGTPLTIVNLFTDTPRALAVSPDGNTVYAAGFQTGNKTTVLNERIVTNNGFLPAPHADHDGNAAPLGALIVKNDGTHWTDELGRVFDSKVNFNLPDKDVFAIDAAAAIPAQKADHGFFAGVGTVLFNMAVNPVSGKVYVSNTEARNEHRFEGHNTSGGTGSVRGHIAESRITVLDGASVTPRHLNKHIDYTVDGNAAEAEKSLAFPTGMAVTKDGGTLYVAALGSSKVGVFGTKALEDDTFVPSTAKQIELTGGGPTGMVLADGDRTMFVLTRFDNSISVVDLKHQREISHVAMYNPEPTSITKGRKFLYDAKKTSSHGDSACASCHVFGDFDSLAWDLGDPDGSKKLIPGPFTFPLAALGLTPATIFQSSMKGPMTTQSLRGMANHGAMHWRGDRNGGLAADGSVLPSAQPDTGSFDEQAAFRAFNVAFPGLLGNGAQLSAEDMQSFTDFILQVTYPPNPVRNLDNSLTAQQQAGRDFYFNHVVDAAGTSHELPDDTFHNCNGCHTLDSAGNKAFGVAKPGFFGSSGLYSFEAEPQFMKVPHLRNAYQKVGMFGMTNTFGLPIDAPPPTPALAAFLPPPFNDLSFQGDQIRGFGFLHDGSIDTMYRFFGANVFTQRPATDPLPNPFGIPRDAGGLALRRSIEAFVLAFDTNLAPIVGQQVTLSADNASVAGPRIDLFEARAAAGECDLVVKSADGHGYFYSPTTATFTPDRKKGVAPSDVALRALASGKHARELTFTCVPLGSGQRIGIDRDLNGTLDGDEKDHCDD